MTDYIFYNLQDTREYNAHNSYSTNKNGKFHNHK